jgi:hypothetical protein
MLTELTVLSIHYIILLKILIVFTNQDLPAHAHRHYQAYSFCSHLMK